MRSTETCDWRDSQVMHGPWIGEPTGEEGRHFFSTFKTRPSSVMPIGWTFKVRAALT